MLRQTRSRSRSRRRCCAPRPRRGSSWGMTSCIFQSWESTLGEGSWRFAHRDRVLSDRETKPRGSVSDSRGCVLVDAPGGIRTHDLRLRRPTLYPAELLARIGASGFEPPTSWSRTSRANRAALRPEHAPRRTRTPSLLIRSQALYPVELWALDNCGLSISDCGLGTWLAAGASRRANPQFTIRNPQSRHGR